MGGAGVRHPTRLLSRLRSSRRRNLRSSGWILKLTVFLSHLELCFNLSTHLEGLPRGVILPESCMDLTKHQEDDDDEEESYLTAEEDEDDDQSRGSLRKVNVATQTDPLPSNTCCVS